MGKAVREKGVEESWRELGKGVGEMGWKEERLPPD